MALHVVSIGLALSEPWFAVVILATVAVLWLVPDRRIERYLAAVVAENDAR